jgi:hypothetical protein
LANENSGDKKRLTVSAHVRGSLYIGKTGQDYRREFRPAIKRSNAAALR